MTDGPESLPAPLVPVEVNLKKYSYVPIEIARLQKSKTWLRAKRSPAIGFHAINLWMAAWHEVPAASLEDDDDVLADRAMCSPDKWAKVRADVMRGWVKCSDGRLYHPVVAEKALEVWKKNTTNRDNMKAARDAKQAKRNQSVNHQPQNNDNSATTPAAEQPKTSDSPSHRSASALKREGEGKREGERESFSANTQSEPPRETGPTPPGQGLPVPPALDRQAAVAIIAAFDESRATIFGANQARPYPSPKDLSTASRWLAAGATLDLCRFVFDAQNAKIKSQQREPMNALSAFDRDISDAIANGKRPMPAARPPGQRSNGNGPRQPELSVAEKQTWREKWGLTRVGWTAELEKRIRENNLQDRWHKGA